MIFSLCQLRSVCSRLREAGVTGHLGVFRTHYEADNSRLYVVCAKNLTEAQISQEFIQFGPMEVKLNTDANSISKVRGQSILIAHFQVAIRLFQSES